MGLSLPHLIVLALVVLLLFGRGKISDLMGDFGKGIKSFKEGVADETTNHVATPPAQLTAQPAPQYAPPVGTVATPHPEVLPHGQAPAQGATQPVVQPQVQPLLNGEPLPDAARAEPQR